MKDDFGQPTYPHPPVLDETRLIAFLKTQPDIAAAYLFGSLAQGRAAPRSDIDIAILLKPVPKQLGGAIDRQLKLMDDFRGFADREVDVVILNTAPPVLKDQVLRYGRRLYESDRTERVDFEVRTGTEVCLDIGRRIIALEGFRYADDNQDVFRILAAERIVSRQLLEPLLSMARFRNLVVHDYAKIDDEIVYGILKKRLGVFDAYAETIRIYLTGD